jgi:L-ribulose-5-phosphate 3-epimerase
MSAQSVAGFAVNTYSYTMRYSALATVDNLADMGYLAFELMMYPGHLWPADTDAAARRQLRRHIAERGLRVTTLNMPNVDLNIAGATAEMRAYSLGILSGIFQLAADLEVPAVVIGPGKSNPLFSAPKELLLGHLFAALDALVPLAHSVGISILIENMPFAFLPDIQELLDVVDRYGEAGIGIVYDVANGHFIHEDVAMGLRKAAPRLRLVHISDTGHDVYRHDPVGQGSVPFAVVPPVLSEIGYRGPSVLEIISDDADAGIARSTAQLAALGWRTGAG